MTANKTVVLLANLGTPDAPTTKAVRKYLAEFLSDRRVIRTTPFIWLPILYGIILPTRPKNSAAAYQKIWTEEGSPLLTITLDQAEALDQRLGEAVTVLPAMRYGNPSIKSVLDKVKNEVEKLIVLPMYPQYSTTTTLSTFDAIENALKGWDKKPQIKRIDDYHNHPDYIDALANSVINFREKNGASELLIFSFHGLPKEYIGDDEPYLDQCKETTRLVAQKLKLEWSEWLLSFHSRVGPKEWLKPYTDETVKSLAESGRIKTIDVICPGFSADCLETLEEIAMENLEFFTESGGEDLRYIPALNASADHIEALAKIVEDKF
ncbi:MAG: ferrochelatase [Gammaproteobacteria bacterium]